MCEAKVPGLQLGAEGTGLLPAKAEGWCGRERAGWASVVGLGPGARLSDAGEATPHAASPCALLRTPCTLSFVM